MARACLLAACLMMYVINVHGQGMQYFFSAQTGNDENSGTSADKPWKSLAQASRIAFTSVPTSIFLERGSVWSDETLAIGLLSSTIITSYGNTSLARPRIGQSRYMTPTARECVSLIESNNTYISDLHLTGCKTGIALIYSTARRFGNITITNNFFSDIKGPFSSYNPSAANWATAIEIVAESSPTIQNIAIRNNFALRIDTFYGGRGNIIGLDLNSNTISKCNGNCISMSSGTDLHLRNSVFVRDIPEDLFLYGTTDVIVGSVSGQNSVENTDFNQRGEFQGGPDGCALDFETSANGFNLTGCTFSRSYGAGIMVFGHATTSHGLNISANNFLTTGCTQARDDRGGIGFMCPNNQKPSGIVGYNKFWTCPNSEAMHQRIPDCDSNMTMVDNIVNEGSFVAEPQINLDPPAPTSTDPNPSVMIQAESSTPNATLRYTLDGSRPVEDSPVLPTAGLSFVLPGPNFALNVRGFKSGMTPSVTNTMMVERATYLPRGSQSVFRSSWDVLSISANEASVNGWIVDMAADQGTRSISYMILVDGQSVSEGTATVPRPDLVKAGVAPNPNHGFSVDLPASTAALLQHGYHSVDIYALDCPSAIEPRRVQHSPKVVLNGNVIS